jgi:transposase
MGTARRQFTGEFKLEAVGLLASSGRPLSQIAQELGIAPSRLRAWRNKSDGGHAGSPRRPNTQAAISHAGADLAAETASHGPATGDRGRCEERRFAPVHQPRPRSIRTAGMRPRKLPWRARVM